MRFWGSTRSLWDRDRQTGPATPWNSVCSWREPPMLSTPLAGTPQTLPAWESHPKFSKERPANASPKAATCCTTPGVGLARAGGGFLSPRAAETSLTCATAFPARAEREESSAGIAKAASAVPMLRRHRCKRGLWPLPPLGRAGQDVLFA